MTRKSIITAAMAMAGLLAGTAGGAEAVGTPSSTQSTRAGGMETRPQDPATVAVVAQEPPEVLSAGDSLQAGFQSPPASAHPELFWDWMHDMVTKEGITYDLEVMKRMGFSGALIMLVGEVDAKFNPTHHLPNPVRCMTPEFFEHWKFAAEEADRLGLTLVSQCGPGWCHSGGPWITKENAVQHLDYSETTNTGPAPRLSLRLQKASEAVFQSGSGSKVGEAILPAPGAADFTRDVAIVALPKEKKTLEPGEAGDKAANPVKFKKNVPSPQDWVLILERVK